jgi:phosphoribosylanthranilate isomerase
MIIQVYEIQTPAEVEPVVKAGVNRVGSVILSEESWKSRTLKDTVDEARLLGVESSIIPLFSDRDLILRSMDYYHPDVIHFCEALTRGEIFDPKSRELARRQGAVRERFPEISVMRSIPIAPPGYADRIPTLALAELFEPVSDIFLTDTLLLRDLSPGVEDQPVSGFVGITGKTCDWDMASSLVKSSSLPVILAGGLSPENVAEGVLRVRPAGVDSCTRTNQTDDLGNPVRFRKDLEKVRRFVEAALGGAG